eukprot:TRINITY_DN1250_c0_g4_i1.p1 TRINITY_DN1250_c0_g4~~TRINITY_DN1250_c0_g4_i1.p1  ORF type:complete len:725 (+),score=206.63 TRINITY_DN1250_c0_g4_i1:272-2446(+)
MECFKMGAEKHGEDVAYRQDTATPEPKAAATGDWISTWKETNYQEYYQETLKAGRAFMSLGIEQFDTVAIIGFNSPEWFLANMGAIAAGGKAAGIYTTNGPTACQYIAEHSKSKVVVVEDSKHLAKFLTVLKDPATLPDLTTIIMWTGDVPEEANGCRVNVVTWPEFIARHEMVEPAALEERIAAQRPGHPCTLIYTSGTTGNPKAVMITHDNCCWTSRVVLDWINLTGVPFGESSERIVSYLPLSHIAAQMLDIHMPLALSCHETLPGFATVTFARPDALKGTIKYTLQRTLPTQFFGVPRVWEKFQEAIITIGRTSGNGCLSKIIKDWAKNKGHEAHMFAQGKSESLPWGMSIASIVFDKVKSALGLTQCKLFYTGAAPISASTLEFFGCLGIHVLELYGMSECSGPQTITAPGLFKVGSVGHSLPGCEIGILQPPSESDLKEDPDAKAKPVLVGQEGEICFRGRHVMLGYMGEGMEEKTAEAIDSAGWLHSGDKGKLDENGMLYITGRYKELLITAGGENIAPIPIEDRIKDALGGIIEECVMVADKRKFCSCLFVLKTLPGVNDDGQPIFTNQLAGDAADIDPACTTIAEAAGADFQGTPAWKAALTAGIAEYNKNPVSQAAKIQSFRICRDGFSVGNGLLTDTMKLKRSKVYAKHSPLIELLYAEADASMAESASKKAKTDEETSAAEQDLHLASSHLEACQATMTAQYGPHGDNPTDF